MVSRLDIKRYHGSRLNRGENVLKYNEIFLFPIAPDARQVRPSRPIHVSPLILHIHPV